MRALVLGALGALCLGASACVAQIREERLFGAPRTLVQSKSETIEERRVAADGSEGAVCREVAVTYPIVRDVTVRRYFADDAQDRNIALATLLGAGIGFLEYGTNQAACSHGTGACPDFAVVAKAELGLLALSAIPLAFLAYNAIRVQDRRTFEYVTPRWTPRAWEPCQAGKGERSTSE